MPTVRSLLYFTILKEPTILDYRSLLYFDYTNSILTVAAPSTIRRRSQLRMATRSATSCGLGVVGSGRILEGATEGG